MSPQHLISGQLLNFLVKMDGLLQRQLARWHRRDAQELPMSDLRKMLQEGIAVDGDVIRYTGALEAGRPGLYVVSEAMSPERCAFDVELLSLGASGDLVVGLVLGSSSPRSPTIFATACYVSKGRLCLGDPRGGIDPGGGVGNQCAVGDQVGVRVLFREATRVDNHRTILPVFFTHNGKPVGRRSVLVGGGGLLPAVGLGSPGQAVRLAGLPHATSSEDVLMCVDSHEDEWLRLRDIRLNGPILEYTGKGVNMDDVGQAQAKHPLDTTSHYFEIEILDPGENCYIAIGVATRNYPQHRHPGWNEGSVAYHADDGKIFEGSGVGSPFGPRCEKGDVMGCGILFPRDYVEEPRRDSCGSSPRSSLCNDLDDDDSDSDNWWHADNDEDDEDEESGVLVQVFFTRNGTTIGKREVPLPRGGLYPTVGMLSCREKVRVDLHPLTG
ncbi:SPRY domain-containing protein 3-like isoform X2 [Ornithodoros turicata]|uniref:SPRY domain-containing protein 3-like isoform X2 n=1 Tax=Ornithodoros turicata TaxID=34597 RepID=UPI00313A41A4